MLENVENLKIRTIFIIRNQLIIKRDFPHSFGEKFEPLVVYRATSFITLQIFR